MKFRDEPRPRGGLLRCREFMMKDAYSFDVDEEGAKASYETMRQAYVRIFDRMGLTYRMVAGRLGRHRRLDERRVPGARRLGRGRHRRVRQVRLRGERRGRHGEGAAERERAPHAASRWRRCTRRGTARIEEVTEVPRRRAKTQMLKSLALRRRRRDGRDGRRARRSRRERGPPRARARRRRGVPRERGRRREGDRGEGRASPGPSASRASILVDPRGGARARRRRPAPTRRTTTSRTSASGATTTGEVVDLRLGDDGRPVPELRRRQAHELQRHRGGPHLHPRHEVLRRRWARPYIDEKQQKKPIVMGCYGIGVSRLVATTIEQHHDDNGIRWPMSVAPYQVHLVTIGKDDAVLGAAREALRRRSRRAGVEVLWDDRDERPGVKFKDADLIGIPLRVTIGAKGAGRAATSSSSRAPSPIRRRPSSCPSPTRARRRWRERVRAAAARVSVDGPHRSPAAAAGRSRCDRPRSPSRGEVEASVGAHRRARARARRRRGAPWSSATRTRSTAGSMNSPVPLAIAKTLADEASDARRVGALRLPRRGQERGHVRRRARGGRRRARRDRAPARRAPGRAADACAGTPSARGSASAPRRRDGRRRARAARRPEHALLRVLGRRAVLRGPEDHLPRRPRRVLRRGRGARAGDAPRRGASRLRGVRPPLHEVAPRHGRGGAPRHRAGGRAP